jgi:hypothetical protein
MVASVVLMALYFILIPTETMFNYVILTGETLCLLAFGFAWIAKGELILKDKD